MRRSLRFWPLLATIYFCVSGGPFGLESVVQGGAGLAMLLLIVTPLVWSAPAALMTAELTSAMPEEGGYYVWVKRALGPPWAFLCGWWTWVYSWVDSAIYPTVFATYAASFLRLSGLSVVDLESHSWLKWSIGLIIIVPLTLLNLRGTKPVGETSVSFLVTLFVPFVVLVLLGIGRVFGDPQAVVHPFVASGKSAVDGFGVGLFAVMWNYLGWDSISTVAGEVEEPEKIYPRALILGIPLVTFSYLLPVAVGLVVMKDSSQWVDGAFVQVANLVAGKWLALAVAGAGMVAAAGLFASTLLAGSRLPFVMSEDGHLPPALAKLHPKYGTPWNAILISAAFYTAFSFASFKDLAVVDVVLYSSALFLEFLALAVLRKKKPTMSRPYKIPGGWPVLIGLIGAPTALIVFACYSRFQEKGDVAVKYSLEALATGPLLYGIGQYLRRRSASKAKV